MKINLISAYRTCPQQQQDVYSYDMHMEHLPKQVMYWAIHVSTDF